MVNLTTSFFSATGKSTSCRSPCMDFLPPSGGVFRLSLVRGHRRVSHADGHAVFKVQQAKRQQKSRHKTDQLCLRFFWKVMLVGYVTAESQNVQPHWGFHCCATLRKRELLKARCFRQLARKSEETFGKKREGRTVPALLTKSNLAIRFLRIVHSLKNCP